MRRHSFLLVLAIAVGWSTYGLAQSGEASQGRPDGSPTADVAPRPHHPESLTRTGTRKPPGAPLDHRLGLSRELERAEQNIKEHTLKSICKGAPGCEGGQLRR
jgi:hypothetical protein